MPNTNNNPEDILGSTASVNAGSAVENVQAEEIKRLEAEKQQAEAAQPAPQAIPNPPLITAEDVLSLMPPAAPLTAADMMQEAAQEAQARTSAAEARAAGFEAETAAPVSPAPSPAPSPRRSSFDAAEANARAANASQGFPVAQDASKITFSAPKDAPDAFDWFAYDEALQAQRIQVAGETPPAGGWDAADDPRIAPSPSYTRTGMEPDLWKDRGNGQVNDAMGVATPELRSQLDDIRAAQTARAASIAGVVPADSPGSFRDRFASYTADWQEVGAAYRQSASEPFAEKFDSFADTAARYGVDTGVLGQRVRGVGMAGVANLRETLKDNYGPLQFAAAGGRLLEGAAP